jgi:hypothetical protein
LDKIKGGGLKAVLEEIWDEQLCPLVIFWKRRIKGVKGFGKF